MPKIDLTQFEEVNTPSPPDRTAQPAGWEVVPPKTLEESYRRTIDAKPDEVAEVNRLSRSLDLSPEAVRSNIGFARKVSETPDLQKVKRFYPVTAGYAQDDWFMAVAKDDLENLGEVEKVFDNPAMDWIFREVTEPLGDAFMRGRGNVEIGRIMTEQGAQGLEQARKIQERMPERDRDLNFIQRHLLGFVGEQAPIIGEAFFRGQRMGLASAMTAGSVAAVAGQAGPQAALPEELLTVPAAAALGYTGGTAAGMAQAVSEIEGGLARFEMLNEGIPEEVAGPASSLVGAVNGLLETAGVTAWMTPLLRKVTRSAVKSSVKEMVKREGLADVVRRVGTDYATAVGTETATEVAQEVSSILGENLAKELSNEQYQGEFETVFTSEEERQRAVDQVMAVGKEVFLGMLLTGAIPAGGAVGVNYRSIKQKQQADTTVNFLTSLGEKVQGTKTYERLPDAVQKLVQRLKADGPIEDVYAPVEQWDEFWQSRGADPEEAVTEAMGSPERYREAKVSGGDIVMPLENFIKLSGAENYNELVNNVRLQQGGVTFNEAQQLGIPDIQEQDVESDPVYQDVFGQLIGIGEDRAVAERQASLWGAFFRSMSERTGMDPMEMYQQYGLSINRDLPQALKRGEFDIAVDTILDRLREGDTGPRDLDIFGPSLLDFLREKGGLQDQGGELSAMDAAQNRQPFQKSLVNEAGLPLDRAREAAQEAGYLDEESDINALLQAVDRELRGERVFAAGNIDQSLLEERQNLTEFQEFLDQMGVSLDQSNEEIRTILQQSVGQGGETFNQIDTKSDAFLKWFGDSKVVDENGKPLVVYHGSRKDLTEFNTSGDGKMFGGEVGSHFGPENQANKRLTDTRAQGDNETIYPAYLSISNPFRVEDRGGFSHSGVLMQMKEQGTISYEEWERAAFGGAYDVRDVLSEKGFDGLVYENHVEGKGEDTFIAFSPTQIKSATGNQGTFDPNDPNILHQRGAIPDISPAEALTAYARVKNELSRTEDVDRRAQLEIMADQYAQIMSGQAQAADFAPELYQTEGAPKLSVLHSLSEENLIFADKMGGLAVPSLAVVKDGMAMEGYGDITLIGRREMADPTQEPVFDSDAYTTTFPRPEYPKAKVKDADRLVSEFKPFIDRFDRTREHVDTLFDNAVNRPDPADTIRRMESANSAKAYFLSEQGLEVEPVIRTKGLYFDFSDTQAMREFFDTNPDINFNAEDDTHQALSEAARKAIDEVFDRLVKNDPSVEDILPELREAYNESTFNDDGLFLFSKTSQLWGDQRNLGEQEVDTYATREVLDSSLEGKESEFHNWLQEKILSIHGDPFLRISRKKEPYTLDNIVRMMTKGRANAQEDTMVFGEGKARAAAAHRFKDLEEIRRLSDQIEAPDKIEAAREEAKELMEEWRNQVVEHFTITNYRGRVDVWEGLDASMRAVARWAKSKKRDKAALNSALRREEFANVPDDVLELGVKAGDAMLMAPVPYFEAKPQRAVDLEEFAGAVIADSTSDAAREILDKHSIPYRVYGEKFDEQARAQAVNEMRGELSRKGEDVLFQDDKTPLASIRFGETVDITLFKDANLSSFLHESGHFFMDVFSELATREGAPQQIVDDWQTVLKWMGVESIAGMNREHYEQFARAFELYLGEGKAPSPELQPIFQRFKQWIRQVYTTLLNLNVELSDEVRRVFDRMLATDEEIEDVRGQLSLAPLFATAEEAGMSPAEFANYQKEAVEAGRKEEEKLTARAMKELSREQDRWWKKERSKMVEEIRREAQENPVYQATHFLLTGETFDGEHPAGAMKLDRDILIKRYGKPFLKRLPRGRGYVYAVEGGVDPDTVAEMFGIDSGDEMLQAMVNAPKMKDAVEAEADIRMRRRHGDMMAELPAQAMNVVHSDQRARILRVELAAIRKKQRDVAPFIRQREDETRQARRDMFEGIPTVDQFKLAAVQMIGSKKILELRPDYYARAEAKAGREAFEAAAKQDFTKAAEAKQRQMLNHFLFREARAARDDADKILDHAKRLQKKSAQKRLAEAGEGFLEQINGLLERYEFKRVSLTELDERESLLEWSQRQEEQGLAVQVDERLLQGFRKNYRQATTEELRAFYDAVRSIEHLAKVHRQYRTDVDAFEWETVKGELVESLLDADFKSTGELGTPNDKNLTMREKGARAWRKFDSELLKVEQLIEWMDGGKVDGPWAKYLFDWADRAQTKEYDLHAATTLKIQELARSMPKEWHNSLMEKATVSLPGIKSLDRYTLVSIALNVGNEGNLQRIRDGYQWTDEQIDLALGQLTEQDWEFVQGIWKLVDSLWPEITDLTKRMSGVLPQKVQPRTVKTQFGEIEGGYFPLVYDPKTSSAGAKQADAVESVQDFMARGYGVATTPKGHTKERMESVNAAPLLDYERVLSGHVNKVVKDISHREAVYYINKILKDPEIKTTMIDRVGEARYLEMNKWLQTLISDRADTLTQNIGLMRLFRGLRTNMAIVTMGWKISTFVTQYAGIGPAADLVRPSYLGKALVRSVNHPWESWRFIEERSGEMKHRALALDRDMKDALLKLRNVRSKRATIQKTAFYLAAMADRMVSVPTWIGAYDQAIAGGLTEKDAIRAGDRAVRLSQGAGGAKDLASVQRHNDLMKLLTMYYTPFSALYARLRDMGRMTKGPKDLPRLVARSIALVIFPAVISEIIAGRGPDDDDDPIWWAIHETLLYPVQSVPVLRDAVGGLEVYLAEATGVQMDYRPGYRLTPITSAYRKVVGALDNLADAFQGDEDWDDVAWDSLEASGYIWGLPTTQVRITGEYLEDLLTGDGNTDNIGGLVFRRPKE